MATLDSNAILTVRTTIGSKVANLGISDGQLIFVRDKRQVALDFDGRRTFYNLIEELATDGARLSLLAPVTGAYYFVVETGVLWAYQDDWIRLTTSPEEITEALEEAVQSGEFNGKDGYSPVRGTDYWTEADKAEIKSYVDQAILNGAW